MIVTINVPDNLPKRKLKRRIRELEESLKNEAKKYNAEKGKTDKANNDLKLFLESFGSWQDNRSAEEIIEEIYMTRISDKQDIQL